MKRDVTILTIGDELLIGQVVDTNSAWIGELLTKEGFYINEKLTISDKIDIIAERMKELMNNSSVVIITGGLGATNDDVTKSALCKIFNSHLAYNVDVENNIIKYHSKTEELNSLMKTQTLVPHNCEVIINRVGTAPIMWFETEHNIVVSLPGVPSEMKSAMTNDVMHRLKNRCNLTNYEYRVVHVLGIPESILALNLSEFEKELPTDIKMAYLPHYDIVRLRLSGVSENREKLSETLDTLVDRIKEIVLDKNIISYKDISLEQILVEKLQEKELTISTAESCTGGKIATRIVSVAGSSLCFRGSIVAYHNDIKHRMLNVENQVLERCGAVSETVVEQMSIGVSKLFDSDVSIAVSGVAGPSGGTDYKPVGTVWIATNINGVVESRKCYFRNSTRAEVINKTVASSILILLKRLIK